MCFFNNTRLFTFALCLTWYSGLAQNASIRKANEAMKSLDFMTAIVSFQQGLQHSDDTEAAANLAECYRRINDIENATLWYGKAARAENAKPIYKLYYGMMLQAQEECDSAKQWFKSFLEAFPDDARGQFYARACDLAPELREKNKDVYTVIPLPFNSNLDDFSPSILGNQVIFASDRDRGTFVKRTSMWTGNPFSDLYSIPFDTSALFNGQFNALQPEKFSKELNTKYNEAAVSVSSDGQTIYFTRNNYLDGKLGRSEDGLVKLKIYVAHKNEKGDWIEVRDLPFNSDEFHTAFPALSPDGKQLFFSSNKPGGFGGMDLYVSNMNEAGVWGPAINLGPVINTESNEIFPFMAKNNRLYFASNGHIGLGRLDIFYSTQQGAIDAWNLPVNLGAPVNSCYDDFGISFGGEQSWGFFTSDRKNGGSETRDDIYAFRKSAAPVEIVVLDAQSRKPLSGVLISNKVSGLSLTTGMDGKIGFDMRYESCADFTAEKKGYEPSGQRACARAAGDSVITQVEILLQRQAVFYVQGIVFDMVDGMPADGVSLMLQNNCGKSIPEAIITDEDGRFKFKLDKDCCYTVRAVHDGYLSGSSEMLCTQNRGYQYTFKSYINLIPFQEQREVSTEGKNANGKVRFNEEIGLFEYPDGTLVSEDRGNGLLFKNGLLFDNGALAMPDKTTWKRSETGFLIPLYYEFNQITVNDNSMYELDRLAETLNNNPEMSIEIASHTDSRGSDDYNLSLSQQRADYLVDWLVRAGISKARLVARGYGETQPVNQCINDVPCDEASYQENRRTEFRIIPRAGQNPDKKTPCPGCPF